VTPFSNGTTSTRTEYGGSAELASIARRIPTSSVHASV
jgi:hypothetical protein